MSNILVIPDAHIKPDQDLVRFEALGLYITKTCPDKVVIIGDFFDMESLCTYDYGKKSFEGRNYQKDLEAGQKAIIILFKTISIYNALAKSNKRKLCNPEWHFFEGNHEYRYTRFIEYEPKFEGSIKSPIELMKANGMFVYPFLDIYKIDGLLFSHYYNSGDTFKAISGVNAARNITLSLMESSVSGHSHLLDYHETTTGAGKCVKTLVCGNFLAEDQVETYAKQDRWSDSGICMLHNVEGGKFDLEVVSLNRLMLGWRNHK